MENSLMYGGLQELLLTIKESVSNIIYLLFFADYPDIIFVLLNYNELAKARYAAHMTISPLSYQLQYKFS